MASTRILFVGGGSIGHIAPCVAVWRACQKIDGAAESYFICTDRKEDGDFLRKENVPFTQIPVRRFSFGSLTKIIGALHAARRIIREYSPDVVFSKGGALSIPVTLAAKFSGVPVVLHESDAVSGRANRLISKWATNVCTGFPTGKATSHWPLATGRTFTGNPIRPEVTQGSREQGLRLTGFSGQKPILLVTGGSQGAVAINDAIARHLKELLMIADVIHLTGKGKQGAGQHEGYWSQEFAQHELPHLYAVADLAISRGGAGNIGELAACGIPTIIIPLRGVGHDHQLRNAEAASRSGGCVLLHQEAMDGALLPAVTELLTDAAARRRMHDAVLTLHVPDAADRIASIVLETGKHDISE